MIEDDLIEEIIGVIYDHQMELSDGFDYYAGEGNVHEVLKEIAKEILKRIK